MFYNKTNVRIYKVINMQTNGINHINLTVTDLDRSRKFYGELLGFKVENFPDHNVFRIIAGKDDIWFITHEQTETNDKFSEFRVGLDHLSFTAPDREALDILAEKLKKAGVETKGVEQFVTGNYYIAFRDPDNIQLEYWLN
jgi:glyoxylase I family protein